LVKSSEISEIRGFSMVFPRFWPVFPQHFPAVFGLVPPREAQHGPRGAELRQAFAAAVQTWRQALGARQIAGVEPAPGSLELDIYS